MKQLNEVRRMQQLAGLLIENLQQNSEFYRELVDDIVNKAGSKSAEYDFTKEVLKDRNLYDDGSTLLGLYDFAKHANYHEIADACADIMDDENIGYEEPSDDDIYNGSGREGGISYNTGDSWQGR